MRPLFFGLVPPIIQRMRYIWPVMILSSLLLASCGDPGDDPAVGGLTSDEAAQLNAAAETLDAAVKPPPFPLNDGAPRK